MLEQPHSVTIEQQPINGQPSGLQSPSRQPRKRLVIRWVLISLAIIAGLIIGALLWYNNQLSPKSTDKNQLIAVTIVSGSNPVQIGELLQDKSVIRSAVAFDFYTRLSGNRGNLQAGTYRLSPSESTREIVGHLANGTTDSFDITFLPGATVNQDRKVLLNAGFQAEEIDRALTKTYDSPLFQTKPAGSSLEGYIYGETYKFNSGATVEQILTRAFDEFYSVVTKNDLIARFKTQGLNLYQGITLASIIQREVSVASDQKQVAQVFYTRLHTGITLGSDVTFIYAANKLNIKPVSTLDSPYNTRIYAGLPPGPIASPGLGALQAVAAPASGDYVYFISGDDNITYFSRTAAEHDANIANHCKIKCNQP